MHFKDIGHVKVGPPSFLAQKPHFEDPQEMRSWRLLCKAAIGIGLLAGLYLLSLHSVLLFHSVIEMFTVGVSVALFLLAWNSRGFANDDAFVFLGSAHLCVAVVVLLHTLSYKGMGIFQDYPGANLTTQLWIISRYLESGGLLLFLLFIGQRAHPYLLLLLCLGLTGLLLASVFLWRIFPACYVEGAGLTSFKILSEYVVCLILLGAGLVLHRRRDRLDPAVFNLLIGALALAVLASLAFTAYVSVYGLSNIAGHYFHLVSFFLIYRALIRSSLVRPYATLFRELSVAQDDLGRKERYFRSILDHLHEEIRIIEPGGTVVEVNRTYLEANGLQRKDVIGRRCDELHLCDESSGCRERCGLDSVFSEGFPISRIHKHRKPDGRVHHENITFAPLKDESGLIYQVIAAGRDVTDLVEARNAVEWRLAELNTIMDSTADGILAMGDRGEVLHANRRFLEMWELPFESVLSDGEVLRAERERGFCPGPPGFLNKLREAHATIGAGFTTLRLQDGRTIERYSRPLAVDADRSGIVWSFRDVTAQKQMEAQLESSERRLRTLVEEAPISIMTFDAQGRIDFVNEYHVRNLARNQLDKQHFTGRKLTELPGLLRSGRAAELEPVLRGEPVVLDEVFIPDAALGFTGYQRIKAVPLYEEGTLAGGILIREDITAYRRMAAAVEDQAEHYRAIINTTKEGFWLVDTDRRIREVNDAACEMTGYDRDELLAMTISDVEASESTQETALRMRRLIESGSGRFETRHLRKDGRVLDIEAGVTYVPSPRHFVCFFHDITERKRAEAALRQSEEKLRAVFQLSPAALAIATFDEGRNVDVNDAYLRFTGLRREQVIGRTPAELGLWYDGDELEAVQDLLALHGRVSGYSTRLETPNGAREALLSVERLKREDASLMIVAIQDVTDLREAVSALRVSLEEKVALLKEVHHRVKNNLQIVASLLSLQAGRSMNREVLDILDDTRSRVHAMALLHETLYRSENLARTDFAGYVGELCAQLLRSAGVLASRIEVENRLGPVSLPLEQAVPCGLIINELVSNALKHAFPDGRGGKITVEIQTWEGRPLLIVSDNGIGLGSDFSPSQTRTLGLQLVARLARQLGGELAAGPTNGAGTAFTVSLPALDEGRQEDD